jgi:RND family efflux transporter MFP subunit
MITEAILVLKNAQKDYDRFTTLYQQQSSSAKELENITLQYNAAKARLEVAKQSRNELNASLNYTNLTAPFAGIITQKTADAGSMANPGMPLLTIEKGDSYQLSAVAPENIINQIHTGASVVVTIASANKTFEGKVALINQSSQFTGGQYLIKISIPERDKNGLYAGMYANVQVLVKQTTNTNDGNEQVMVPSSSIEYKDQLAGLYTIGNNNTALLRWVRLGRTIGSNVEVLSGLAANEQFIMKADGKLYNGVQVKIK